ncbi:hypothetical protein EVAR_14813_1 [Eumeta japonica]|uniref:Uncharacterized protein n=1 Tax=Eumeta variegata TaxID=151549 RepID=A0A4C1TWW1_EUMVA|nr:hypothetical protein EVAR_14813_1 [Eumeta japonica]
MDNSCLLDLLIRCFAMTEPEDLNFTAFTDLCRLCSLKSGPRLHIFDKESEQRQILFKLRTCLPTMNKYALEKLYFFGIIKNEPKLDGVASFNYGVPMATFQLHHQTLITIEYQSTRQDESNEPKLDRVASFNYGVPMAIFQLHHQTLITI